MVERFLDIEKTYGLFDKRVDGYAFWPSMRFNVFSALRRAMMPIAESHPDFNCRKTVDNRWRFFGALTRRFRRMCDYLKYNPILAVRKRPLLFALEPRIMPIGDRGNIPIMIDFIAERLAAPHAVLEYAAGKSFAEMPFGYRIFRPSASTIRKMLCKRSVRRKSVSDLLSHELELALSRIEEEFSVSLPKKALISLSHGQMVNYKIYRPVFAKYLRRLGVKCVVTSVHYHPLNMILGEVAHEMGIRRVELMHGLVSREHIAYNLPQKSALHTPDDLLVWGEFWKAGASNYPFQNIVATGYPLFNYVRSCYPKKTSVVQKQVLFISQGAVGETLSKLAVTSVARVRLGLSKGSLVYWLDVLVLGVINPFFLSIALSAAFWNFYLRRNGCSVTSSDGIRTMLSLSRNFFPSSPNSSTNTSYGVLPSSDGLG